jgi:uncharacterized protein
MKLLTPCCVIFKSFARSLFFLFISVFLSCDLAWGLKVPTLTGPVVDQARILTFQEHSRISYFIENYFKKTGNQFQVLILKSLEGEVIENFSIKVVDQWQLGKKGDDRGLLLLLAMKERELRIEVGRGLEGSVTDFKSAQIIRQMAPFLRQRQFAQSILFALNELTMAIDGKYFESQVTSPNSSKSKVKKKNNPPSWFELLFIIILLIIFIRNPRLFYYLMLFSNGGSSRGRGSGRSGGGWSGGGGGFGGGGASGRW